GSLSAAQAQLALQNIQPCYGPLGPERPVLEYRHWDRVCFRFLIKGASADDEGIAKVRITTQLTDADGKTVGTSERTATALLQFGPTFAEAVTFPLPQSLKAPGEYTLHVTVKDERSGQTAAFGRKLTLLADGFAICAPGFFADPDGEIDLPF